MDNYEYLVVPAPRKGAKVKGLKTPADRYAHQMTLLLNDLAAEGWEYWRADTLASDERKGLTGTTQVNHDLLIFRRLSAAALATHMPAQHLQEQGYEDNHQPDHSTQARSEPQLGSPDRYYEDNGPRLTESRRD